MVRTLVKVTLSSAAMLALSLSSACATDEGSDEEEEVETIDSTEHPDLKIAKQATAEYNSIAAAEADGWADSGLPCLEGQSFHWLNPAFLGSVDPRTPAALMYDFAEGEDDAELIALEWIVPITDPANPPPPPTMFGQTFHGPNAIPGLTFYALHTWVWLKNKDGVFADQNPKVTCTD